MNDERNERYDTQDKRQWEAPAIVYEGTLTTRSRSVPGQDATNADPADLFGTVD